MIPYKESRPTQFDAPGLALPDQQHWMQLEVSQTRDSDCLTRSNFAAALEALGGESDTVEVHRFGHWGPGWFEIILIDPSDTARIKIAEDIEAALADYPVLDDSAYSELEQEAIQENWENFGDRDLRSFLEKYFELGYTPDVNDELTDPQFEALKDLLLQFAHYDIMDAEGNLDLKHCEYLLNEKISQDQIDTAFNSAE